MTKEEYIEAKKKAGHIIHQHDGVWWETSRLGYCKPAVRYEAFEPLEVRPAFERSFIGYNHRVLRDNHATGFWKPFIMKGEELQQWEVKKLSSKGRKSSITKGLRENEVRRLDLIDNYKKDIANVLISTAERVGHGFPASYYALDNPKWWEVLKKIEPYTEYWASFYEGKMTAYICIHVMGDRVVVDGVKSDTDLLNKCPIDALLYSIITDLQHRGGIKEIWYGGKSDRPSLDKFKESYGFKVSRTPYTIRFAGGLIKYPTFSK
jgi:hypothetical protein